MVYGGGCMEKNEEIEVEGVGKVVEKLDELGGVVGRKVL